ncbi:MAG: hypothetical protein LBR10_02850 [Prevotellaceae bacterium]|jgi:hypothetical protein|nr:hypothetical protein [Prevotellaceae bacterium]
MKKIIYLVPYFGKLPQIFPLWLKSAECNPTINWKIFTDDDDHYDYPTNVNVVKTTFVDFANKFRNHFDFNISLDYPYKLCEYKVTYGDVLADQISEYDYWGYCDLDLIFGDIREFITSEVLSEYEMIGFQGHSTLYKNVPEVNKRYTHITENVNYRTLLSSYKYHFFDEHGILEIYEDLNLTWWSKVVFANISPMYWNFRLTHQDKTGREKNKNRIFTWNKGKLYSHSLVGGKIVTDEFMYVHFLRREMKIIPPVNDAVLKIIPNKFISLSTPINPKMVKYDSRDRPIYYWINLIWRKRKKMTTQNIIRFLKHYIKHRKIDKKRG